MWKIPDLYKAGNGFIYWYTRGWNLRALAAWLIAITPSMRKLSEAPSLNLEVYVLIRSQQLVLEEQLQATTQTTPTFASIKSLILSVGHSHSSCSWLSIISGPRKDSELRKGWRSKRMTALQPRAVTQRSPYWIKP